MGALFGIISKALTLQNHEPEIQETVVETESSVTCECCSTRYVDERGFGLQPEAEPSQAHEDKKNVNRNDDSAFCRQ